MKSLSISEKWELFFNDLSVGTARNNHEGRDWFNGMFEAIATLINNNVCGTEIHSSVYIHNISLTSTYSFIQWACDQTVDYSLRELAWHLTTRAPVEDILKEEESVYDDFIFSEFKMLEQSEIEVKALGVVAIRDGIAVSLPSIHLWEQSKIGVIQLLYDKTDPDLESVIETVIEVKHVSRPIHTDPIIREWRSFLISSVDDNNELITRWLDMFPYLDRCFEFDDIKLNIHGETLTSVLIRLRQLNEACSKWDTQTQPVPVYPMLARPESAATMRQYGDLRLFTCPRQGHTHFIMHCDIRPKGFRLYWLPDRKNKRLTIGYIGKHLPTAKYKK